MSIPKGVIAHRGASAFAPENTQEAFELARKMGAQWVETDVMLTQDGVAILHHDDDLKRTTGHKGLVAQTPYAIIQGLDAGSWFNPSFAGARIPTLESTLLLAKRLGLKMNLEIKPTVGEEVNTATTLMNTLHRLSVSPDDVLISSFSLKALEVAQPLGSEYAFGWLADDIPSLEVGLQSGLRFKTVNVNEKYVNTHFINQLKEKGYALLAFTVNDRSRATFLLNNGVSAVFSDNPELLN